MAIAVTAVLSPFVSAMPTTAASPGHDAPPQPVRAVLPHPIGEELNPEELLLELEGVLLELDGLLELELDDGAVGHGAGAGHGHGWHTP
jgi:hypothetical protein